MILPKFFTKLTNVSKTQHTTTLLKENILTKSRAILPTYPIKKPPNKQLLRNKNKKFKFGLQLHWIKTKTQLRIDSWAIGDMMLKNMSIILLLVT